MGLVALMLLHESRRETRSDSEGNVVLLDQQDRTRWDQALIQAGSELVERALRTRRLGPYTLQAAIAAVHAHARTPAETDWAQIADLYGVLLRLEPSPIIELNRAVAIAMRDGPAAGLKLVDALLERGQLQDYHLAHSARADMYRRLGRYQDARQAYARALELAKLEPERNFLRERLRECIDLTKIRRHSHCLQMTLMGCLTPAAWLSKVRMRWISEVLSSWPLAIRISPERVRTCSSRTMPSSKSLTLTTRGRMAPKTISERASSNCWLY